MVALKHTMSEIPAGNTRRVYGTAYWDGGEWWAEVGGNKLMARWLDPIQPVQGGKIVIDISTDDRGLATALVIGGYTEQPRPSTGTILAFGVLEIVIWGEDSKTYTTKRYLGPIEGYALADNVYVTWDAATPTILGKVNEITVTPAVQAPSAPATAAPTGYEVMTATASDTYGVGGWGRWATSVPTRNDPGEDVYSGSYNGQTLTGSWFYGPPPPVLAGKNITKVQFRLPGRLPAVGNYNDPVTVNIYGHTSESRPGGDVNRTIGPFTITVQPAAGPQWLELPLAFGAAAGISIAGGGYVGFYSRLDDPQSGKLIKDWAQP